MTIPWIKCSERMPPDDENLYIFKTWTGSGQIAKLTGITARKELCFTNLWEWVPYDAETWRKLNEQPNPIHDSDSK